jgi:1-deoxy-D-xylulose-5-phosphate synthase
MEQAAKRFGLGWLRRIYYRVEESLKSLFLRSVLFEEFGLRYIGPIEGHDLYALMDALAIARDYRRSIVVHVATRKGKGYPPAEANPEKWHGTTGFDVASGKPLAEAGTPTYSAIFGAALERLAGQDERIVAITAAMQAGTGLTGFAQKYPKRFFDVGICEEHAVVFAAGLAASGLRPVFAVYSTFSQRAVDCIIHDVCLQELPVIICLDRAGIVGDDGPTHHGVFDIAMLRPVPNLVLAQPKDEAELGNLLYSAVKWGKPAVIRYPRGSGSGQPLPDSFCMLEPGRAEIVEGMAGRDSHKPDAKAGTVWIWALGDMVSLACGVAALLRERGLQAGVVNARFVRPLDTGLLEDHSRAANAIASIEDGVVAGGFGDGVEECLMSARYRGAFLKFGWPDQFIPQGSAAELMAEFGLTREAIADRIGAELVVRARQH